MSTFVRLPIAARVTASGSTISDMASMVAWATFALEHSIFGAALGILTRLATSTDRGGVAARAESAKLSR